MPLIRHPIARALFLLLASCALAACGSLDVSRNIAGIVTPYRLEILQGNFISKEQVEVLKKGMSRSQVVDTLGTPLVASVFHLDRWDYVFVFRGQKSEPQSRKLAVFFINNQLDRFEGDAMPSEAEFVAKLDSGRSLGKVPQLQATPEALDKFSAAAARKSAAAATAPAAVPTPAAAASYPPLELPAR